MKTPKIIGCSYSVPLQYLDSNVSFMRSEAIDKICHQLSVELHNNFIKETDNDYLRTFEFRAYVVSPSDLEKMIQEGVSKRLLGYPTGIMY